MIKDNQRLLTLANRVDKLRELSRFYCANYAENKDRYKRCMKLLRRTELKTRILGRILNVPISQLIFNQ